MNAAAGVVVVVGGVALELLASNTTTELASDHRRVAVVLVAVIGAGSTGARAGPLAMADPRHPDPRPAAPRGVIAALVQKENV